MKLSSVKKITWCIIDAPNKEAVEKHHKNANVTADFIFEVETTLK